VALVYSLKRDAGRLMVKLSYLLLRTFYLAALMAAVSVHAQDRPIYLDCKLNISRKQGAGKERTFTSHVKYKIQSGIRETRMFRPDRNIWEDTTAGEPATVTAREIKLSWRQYFSADKYERHREQINRITGDVSALNVLALLPNGPIIDSIRGTCTKDQPWQTK
jgi:hypothetical protein